MAKRKQKRRQAGRPATLRTPKQRRDFLALLVKVHGRRGWACTLFGISEQTLRNETERDAEFSEQVTAARQKAIATLVRKGTQLAFDGDGPMIRFLLPKLCPEEFAESQQIEHRGTINHDHDVRITVVEDDDWYKTGGTSATPARLESSGPGPVVPGTIQGGSVRATVGKNGRGSHGHG